MKESSFISKIDWFEGMLYVTLKTGVIYEYPDVPEETYKDFVAAESWGKFFAAHIKHNFEGTAVAEDVAAQWPMPPAIHGSDVEKAWPFPVGSKPVEGSRDPVLESAKLDEYLEWTEEEEQAFLDILNDPNNELGGATT